MILTTVLSSTWVVQLWTWTLFKDLYPFSLEQKYQTPSLPPSRRRPYPCRGSTTMARGWVIFPSIRVLRVCEAFSSRATLMVFLGPSSVQYKLSAIQSTAMPSTVWIPEKNTYCWWEAYCYSTHENIIDWKVFLNIFKLFYRCVIIIDLNILYFQI